MIGKRKKGKKKRIIKERDIGLRSKRIDKMFKKRKDGGGDGGRKMMREEDGRKNLK